MRRIELNLLFFGIVLLSLTFLCSCRKQEGNLVPDDYTSWESTTDVELDYPIPGHVEQYRW